MTATAVDAQTLAFLGDEFLTWLWYRCETQGGVFALPDGEASLIFNDYVALRSGDEGEQSIVKKGSAHTAPEARTALRSGKLVSRARIEIARGERAFCVTLTGERLDLGSAKYPKPEEADAGDREVERLEAMEELCGMVDGLYGLFLAARTAPSWELEERPGMMRWVEESMGRTPGR